MNLTDSDETEYLMSSPANAERLKRAFADVGAGKNIVRPELNLDSGDCIACDEYHNGLQCPKTRIS